MEKVDKSRVLKCLKILIKKDGISKVLIYDAARPNFSIKLLKSILTKMKNAEAVIPKIHIYDAIKQKIDSSKSEYIIDKNRDNFFLTQTPQAFVLKKYLIFIKIIT